MNKPREIKPRILIRRAFMVSVDPGTNVRIHDQGMLELDEMPCAHPDNFQIGGECQYCGMVWN